MTREEYGHRAKVEGTEGEVQAENYSFSHTFLALHGQLAVGGGFFVQIPNKLNIIKLKIQDKELE